MNSFKTENCEFFYTRSGDLGGPVFIWAHGWGQSHSAFDLMISGLLSEGTHIAVDLPGFGQSAPPTEDWGTADYAQALAEFIRSLNAQEVYWIGHSFGCRVGVQLAARHPDLIKSMVLIAGAGLPRKRPPIQKLSFKARIYTFKFLKKLIPLGLSEDWLKSKFGSADYKNAGPLRNLFVRVVQENLSAQAEQIQCPVLLIYGENDTETPPEIGHRYKNLIAGAEMVQLSGQDHYSVLGNGRHQVVHLLKQFIKQGKPS